MALSLKGLLLYKGGNSGPWNVQSEDKSIVDVRAELDKIVEEQPRVMRRKARKIVKDKLKLLSGKFVHIQFDDNGDIMVNEQEAPSI